MDAKQLITLTRSRIQSYSTWANVALLAPIFAAVYTLGWYVRFEGQLGSLQWDQLNSSVGWVVAIKLFVFVGVFGSNQWGKYLTFHDLGTIIKATALASLMLVIGDYLFFPDGIMPRSVFLMDFVATIVTVGSIRAAIRWLRERRSELMNGGGQPVMIVGANDLGECLLREIRRSPGLPYRVVGFIASGNEQVGSQIGGVPVMGTIQDTCRLAEQHRLSEVLITSGELSGKQVRQLVEECRPRDVAVRVLPSFEQLIDGRVGLQPRKVSIEDLLRREPVRLDQHELRNWLSGQDILVTGSAGSIGSEICRQLLQFEPRSLTLVDRSECGQFFLERELNASHPNQTLNICMADGCDKERMDHIFRTYRPSIVFHAAAYKHVPLMEQNRGEAVKNIVTMTKNIADLADEHGIESFVMISTDKAVNPTSIMGACKRVAE
ncbi:MAG: polysaccharide biosynthesis protein, partial [Planctomycetota bacterium]